jgi:hypothetical protein
VARSSRSSEDEALAGMAKVGAPRQPSGTSVAQNVTNASAASAAKAPGGQRPHGSAAAGDPTAPGSRTSRSRDTAQSGRYGAAYQIGASMVTATAPEAAATQASGRLLPSSINRSRSNFGDEAASANAVNGAPGVGAHPGGSWAPGSKA